ncbi:unnamed protein product, partial [marine sediment metagenome]
SYAPVGDTGTPKLPGPFLYPGFLADVYGARYGTDDPAYRFYQALDRPEQKWASLREEFYEGEKRFGKKGRTVQGCSLFEDTGYTVLRAPESQMDACLAWLHNNAGHAHADVLSLVLHWRGQDLLPDAGHSHAYLDYLSQAWDRQSVAHNTVVLNQTSQEPRGDFRSDWIQEERLSVRGELRRLSVQQGKRRLARVEGDKLYPGWQMARTGHPGPHGQTANQRLLSPADGATSRPIRGWWPRQWRQHLEQSEGSPRQRANSS